MGAILTRIHDVLKKNDYLVFAAIIVLVGILLWFRTAPPVKPAYDPLPKPPVEAPEPKIVTKIEKVYIQGPERVQVIEKEKIVEKWRDRLSPDVIRDNSLQVLAAAEIPPWNGPTSVSAIGQWDNNVLKTRIDYRQEPPKFIEWKKDYRVSARYLITGTNAVEADVAVRPLRIGPVDTELGAGIEARRDGGIGVRSYVGVVLQF